MKNSFKVIALLSGTLMAGSVYAEEKESCVPKLAEDILIVGGAITGGLFGGVVADWASGGGTTLCIVSVGAGVGSGGWLAGLVPFACNPVSMAVTATGAAAGGASGAIAGKAASDKLENILCAE